MKDTKRSNGSAGKAAPDFYGALPDPTESDGPGQKPETVSADRSGKSVAQAVHVGSSSGSSATKADIVKRLKKERNGPSFPLTALAQKEGDLHAQSQRMSKLGKGGKASPDANLAVRQVANTVNRSRIGGHAAKTIQNEAVRLYSSLEPEGPVDSMLARQMVGLHNAAMECLERAANSDKFQVRDVELSHATKASKAFVEILSLRDRRQAQLRQKLTLEADVEPMAPKVPLLSESSSAPLPSSSVPRARPRTKS